MSPGVFRRGEFGRFQPTSAGFSSEAGVVKYFLPFSLSHWRGCPSTDGRVRYFLLTFLRQGKKVSGVLGAKPLISKTEHNLDNTLDNTLDNHLILY